MDGRIGRRLLDSGNLVSDDSTILATVVSEDPICVNFDIDERTLLRLRRSVNEGKIKVGTELPVLMRLADEGDFSHRGTVDFTDNRLDPEKGTIRLRAEFPNPRPQAGVRLMSPGMFVHVRLAIGGPYKALLVTDRTVASDQGLHYVYVIDAENKVRYRQVETGHLESDGLRVVLNGLKPDDLVVLGRLQEMRPNLTVKPEKTAMPTLVPPSDPDKKRP